MEEILVCIQNAEHYALATTGPAGLNVVPVRFVSVEEGEVQICNFFMQKTISNVRAGGRTISSGVGSWNRRTSAGCRDSTRR